MPADDPALWLPSVLPSTIILEAAPPGFAGTPPLDIDRWGTVLADRTLSNGRHIVLDDGDGLHHLWLRDVFCGQAFAYVIVRDAAIELRQDAVDRFDRLADTASPRWRHGFGPTSFQRQRHNLLLAILDMHLAPPGPPTSHEIARRLIYPGMKIGRGMEWKSSTERRRTQRLIGEAIALMNGGYRALLRGESGGATKVCGLK